jgi:hypothetical protein
MSGLVASDWGLGRASSEPLSDEKSTELLYTPPESNHVNYMKVERVGRHVVIVRKK